MAARLTVARLTVAGLTVAGLTVAGLMVAGLAVAGIASIELFTIIAIGVVVRGNSIRNIFAFLGKVSIVIIVWDVVRNLRVHKRRAFSLKGHASWHAINRE
jgi:hypothetical protein